jgi:hypothetical protein
MNAFVAGIAPYSVNNLSFKFYNGQVDTPQMKYYYNHKLRQLFVAAVLCTAILYGLLSLVNYILSNQIKQPLAEFRKNDSNRQELKFHLRELEKIRQLKELYSSLIRQKKFSSYYIYHISKILPDKLSLQKIEINLNRQKLMIIELNGHSRGESTIYKFINDLENETFIKVCSLGKIRRTGNKSIRSVRNQSTLEFKITIHV